MTRPTEATLEILRELAAALPFDDTTDFDDARRGLIAPVGDDPVLTVEGRPVWDIASFRFADGDAPDTVNPSLWRQAQVITSDKSRTLYLKRYYHSRWDDPDLYDVMINTEHLTVENAALVVCKALERKTGAYHGDSPSTAADIPTKFSGSAN